MKTARTLLAVAALLACSCGGGGEDGVETLPDFNSMWDYNNAAATEARFRSLIPRAVESGDADYYAGLLTQIARAQGLQGEFEAAHATLDSAYAVIEDEKSIGMARYLLERGRAFNSSGQPDMSRECFLRAYDVAMEIGADFYAVDALHMLGIVEPPGRQMEYNLKALALAEKSGDERAGRWRGSLYNNMGWTYHEQGEYEQALGMFEKSLAFRQEIDDTAGVLIARWTIARAQRSLGNVEDALDMQLDLEEDIEEYGLPPDGYVYEEIGECLFLLGHRAESGRYFGLAYEILSRDDWLAANEPERLKRLKQMSQ
ncbi:MAG: tetratricopeptide repeat protein [bacterium]